MSRNTSAETSYSIIKSQHKENKENKDNEENKDKKFTQTKYLDIDSSYRDRNNYPNPCNFVVHINYPNRNSTASGSINPVSRSLWYHGMFDPFQDVPVPTYQYITSAIAPSGVLVPLDIHEPLIYDFYINNVLQIGNQFRTITAYDGITKIATINLAFGAPFAIVPAGTPYLTRMNVPSFLGTITAVASQTQFTLDATASSIDDIYVGSFIEFGSPSANMLEGLAIQIIGYNALTRTVTVATPFPYTINIGDSVDINQFTSDSASSLLYSGNPDTSIICYYEIELLWISIPVQILNVGYGGYMTAYPYIYVSLFNEGNQMSNQVLYSNNPNSMSVMFKVPIDMYLGDVNFYVFKEAKQKHVVKFQPFQNFRFQITLPDGEILSFSISDFLPPLSVNPLLQVNASFALRKL
jgi:hypothetical protein